MIDGKSIVAVVTARGGSKGLSGKNVRPLNGKPLIGWTIEAARHSKYVDKVIVSSESETILEISRGFGAETPFVRPAEFATDEAKTKDVVMHAVEWLERHDRPHDYILWLSPTNPLRDAEEIDAVVDYLNSLPQARAVATVTECAHHPLKTDVLPDDRSMANFSELCLENRQELPTYYQCCESICLIEWQHFKEERRFITPRTYAYVTSARKGLDIDSISDFLLAEIYMAHPEIE